MPPKGGSRPGKGKDEAAYRGMAIGLVGLMLCGLLFLLYVLGRPLYWKFYAEVIHRYEPDPALALIQEIEQDTGQHIAAPAVLPRKGLPDRAHGGVHAAGDGGGPAAAAAAEAAVTAATQQRQQRQQQQQQQQQQPDGKGQPPDGEPGKQVDLASLSLEELERLREKAREKQWEDDWLKQYTKKEAEKKEKDQKVWAEKDKVTIAQNTIGLTREEVHRIAKDGYLFVTWANHHYTDFAMSWVQHLRALNVTNFLVGAMDADILQSLARRGIPVFSMESGLTTGDFGWGSPTFAKMGRKKINLVSIFLKLDVQVVISDVDVMWLRDPTPFFKRFPDADILTSTDHVATTVGAAEQLEKYPEAGSAFNIGIMLFRKKSMQFVDEWIRIIESDEKIWDQNAFNDLVRKGQEILPDDPNHYFKGDDGKLMVGVLPSALFCSGHVFFTQSLPKALGVLPYAVHATFQFSGTPGKKNRFREAMLWYDKPEYYRSKNGFIAYEPALSKQLLEGGGPRTNKMDIANTIGHFELVNHQLLELRHALALATILNRTLILPPLWCGLDRYWAPHDGRLPGSQFDLPFLCPADHVLDLENGLARQLDEREFGPNIDFREHSFLNNSRLPDAIPSTAVSVNVCSKGGGYCPDGDAPGTVDINKVFLQENMSSDNIKLTLSSVSHVPLLKFNTMRNAFGNFSREEDFVKFVRRVNQLGSVWCCIDAHPGHIHYDFWWDVPHTDKFGRVWSKWEPKPGP